MIGRLALSTLWLLLGAAVSGGVYWGFLNTPESSVGTLLLSAALFLITFVLVAITLNGTVLLWTAGWSGDLIRRSIARVPAFVPAAIFVLLVELLTSLFQIWIGVHHGEINAFFIARFGASDISWLFTTLTSLERWLIWVVAPFLALSWLAKTRFSAKGLLLASVWFGALVVVPWVYLAPWRPRGIPPTSVEMLFITAKLSVTFVLMAIGTSLMIREAVPHGQAVGRS